MERILVESKYHIPNKLYDEYYDLGYAVQNSEGAEKVYAERRLRQFRSAYKQGSYDEAATMSGTIHGHVE